ncbi:glycosyltransferase [Dyella sp. SG609]|uniref:glycosyltransferase n=1 Tax=Dyella sp. SG609 TaxID=2587018 RepID=UPI001835348D|nr:glycosyltransferase [Dyella sp. SG609]NKJ20890.1 GT2 family glycosyltransferase [Dyella sp. SG609]
MQRARASLALRGWHGTAQRVLQEFRRIPEEDEALSLLPLDEPFAPFAVPRAEAPRVSIVIPTYGKLPYTLACLRSIVLHASATPIEIIVVDDAAPDDSAAVLAGVTGLRVLRNERNLGFIGSCNAGAQAARGEFLLFLNNDTQVTSGWMEALLQCFAERSDCGIAGSKLVYPDGRLQEAGGLVFDDGSCWNLGRFESRDAPAWQFRREVDYVSGAALMIRRTLFEYVGCFDTLLSPAYYDDTDLAFAVRAAGWRVYYEPASMVIHCEGISAGTDLSSGMKRFQTINQDKFVAKWRGVLAGHPSRQTALDQAVHWRARGRLLVVDGTTPDASRDSGSLRLMEMFEIFRSLGWSVTFCPDDTRTSRADMHRLGRFGVEILALSSAEGLPRWLAEHGKELRAVMLCRHTVAGQYLHIVRQHAPQAKLIFDTVDLHFVREQRAAELSGQASMLRQAKLSRQSELTLIADSDVTFVVSPDEQALLRSLAPAARVELVSNIHVIHGCTKPHAERRGLLFVGGHGHPPNVDAMRWIAGAILPELRKVDPDVVVHILGDISDALRAELAQDGLQLHGRVADLDPWMETCLASLAPLRFGAGVKGKINMSMSYGLPVIATPLAVEGMHLHDRDNVLLAGEAEAFAAAYRQLRDDPALWSRLSAAGLDNIRHYFSVEAATRTLQRVLN